MLNLTLSFLSIASTVNSPYLIFPLKCRSHEFNFTLLSSKFSRLFNTVMHSISTNNLLVTKCEFSNISSKAIRIQSNDYKLTNQYFTKTMSFSYGNLIITNCQFKNCNSPEEGGALQAVEINIVLICNSFHRNVAQICGAAHLISCHSIQWFGNLFFRNEADYNGAFTIDPADNPDSQVNITLSYTNITLNKAKMWTGGFRIDSSGGKISNCAIQGNSARVAGGFFDFSWTPAHRDVTFSVFINNTSKMRGGAVCAFHLMHSSRYFKSVFIKNKCEEESDAISIQSIDSKVVLEDSIFDGPKDEQIGTKFGYSKFEIVGGTKFGVKESTLKKAAENLAQPIKQEMKNQCKN